MAHNLEATNHQPITLNYQPAMGLMTCDDFREQMNRCRSLAELEKLFCAQWGCVRGDHHEMTTLRRDFESRLEQVDTQPVAVSA